MDCALTLVSFISAADRFDRSPFRMRETNHFNIDRMNLGLIRACEAAGDTDGASSVLHNSRLSSASGEFMSDWDYFNFKSLAVASMLRCAIKEGELAGLARAEVVASQVCSGSEVSVLHSSYTALSLYLKGEN